MKLFLLTNKHKNVFCSFSAFLTLSRIRKFLNLSLFFLACTPSVLKAQIQGKVYRDFNANGVFDSTTTYKEVGLSGITVTAYNAGGTSVGSTTTNSTGNYTIPSVSGGVRVEFSDWLTSYYAAPNGTNNGTSIQFVTAPATAVNYGVNNPAEYCQTNPQIALTCYENGSGVGNTNAAFVTFPYNSTGSTPSPTKDFDAQTLGSVYGVAYQTTAKLAYTAAFLKRHSGLGPRGMDGIYVMSYNTSTPSLIGGFDLQGVVPSNGGAAIDLGTVSRTNIATAISSGAAGDNEMPSDRATANRDLDAFVKVGTMGYGDIDISEDNNALWVVNLNQKALIKIDISSPLAGTTNPNTLSSSKVSQYSLIGATGVPTCTNGQLRPFGLEFKNGRGYVGCVCDASSSSTIKKPSDLKAYVLSFDPASPTTFTQELSVNMDYTREPAYQPASGAATSGEWQRWIDANADWSTDVDVNNTCCSFTSAPQPILSDIDITDDGSMILSFGDRFPHQSGNMNYDPISGNTDLHRAIGAGDIIYAKKQGATFVVEPANTEPTTLTNNPNNLTNDGPNNDGEYFYGDIYFESGNAAHFENSLGASAYLNGLNEVAEIAYDPGGFFSQGVQFYNIATGANSRQYTVLYSNWGDPVGFGKGAALGDIETLCSAAPIEIGNRVWTDTDKDGIQDAGETGINGLTVELYAANGTTLLASTTTSGDGNYYFSSTTTAALTYNTSYVLKFPTTSGALAITTVNSGSNDYIDNDASSNGQLAFTTGDAGQNNHSFDVGYAPCNLTVTPSVSGCYQNSGASKATVSVEVAWTGAPSGDSIAVTLGTQTRYIKPGVISVDYGSGVTSTQTIVSPQVVAFEIDANGATGSVSAAFTTNSGCSDTENFTAPAACPPLACSGNQTGGTVFNDYDADGVKDTGETTGLSGVTVKAFDCTGNLVGTATTDAYGKYTFSGLTVGNYPIRVEFSDLPSVYGKGTPNGTNGRTTTQFVASASCNIDLGVLDPNDYCQTNPQVFVPCFVNGDPLVSGTAANADATVMFAYSNNGLPNQTGGGYTAPTHVATAAQVGTLWGTAYNKNTKRIFQSAILRRHAGLGPQGIGGIYVTDMTNLVAPTVANFIDVEADLGIDVDNPSSPVPSNAARGLVGDKTMPSNDSIVISQIGRVGIGDIDISTDGDTLWFVNMYDKKLYGIDITQYNLDGVTKPTSANKIAYTIPDPNCSNGVARPFGLKIYKGEAYVGVICDGSAAQNKSDLRAYVYKLSGGVWSTVFDFPLTYPKGFADADNNLRNRTGWYPWTDVWNTYIASTRVLSSTNSGWVYPMPLLSDIEFDVDGSMILGFADRAGLIGGNQNYRPNGTSLFYSNVAGGDILRAYYSNGVYVLENAAKAGPTTGFADTNKQGPGFGEFYDENLYWSYNGGSQALDHAETTLGALALRPGSGEVVTTAIDPISYDVPADWSSHPFDIGGIIKSNNATGAKNSGYAVYQGGIYNGVFSKSVGLGDIELGCSSPTYLQVGNYVWSDTDGDGVQDPCEPPLSNVTVTLWKGGTQIASTTTDANGEYYFLDKNASGVTWTGTGADTTLLPSMAYEVRIDTSNQATFIKLALTAANSIINNGNDQNDNDAITTGQYKAIGFTTGAAGSVNHTLDFGFYPFCDTTLVVKDTMICNGSAVDLFTLASGVKGTLSYSTDGTTWTALTSPTNVTPSVTTTYYIKDTLVSGCFDIDTLVITVNPQPTTPSVSSSTTNICPSTTVDLTAIAAVLTPSVSGGVFEWHVSNSPSSAMVSNPNAVVAGDYYLFEKSPAGCYSTGSKVTVVIQVCCTTPLCVPVIVTRN